MSDIRKAAEMALDALETLWDILDDIDTASDMAKENDAWYRKRVEALQKKRWDTMITTDGYKLKDGPVETLRQALAQPDDVLAERERCAEIALSGTGEPVQIATLEILRKERKRIAASIMEIEAEPKEKNT